MSDPNFFLARALENLGPVEESPGGSGYFNAPDKTLDPRLFNGTVLRPEVRSWLLKTFYGYFGARYKGAESWSTVWLAGSGISYQWSGDRSNGDLDVLVGIDWPKFYDQNMDFVGIHPDQASDLFNTELKTNLWPSTAQTIIGTQGEPGSDNVGEFSGVFEVTWYINAGGSDIRDIHPYAAYDVSHNSWTVKPPVLPDNPESLYPKAWFDAVQGEKAHADSLLARYNSLSNTLHGTHPTSAGYQQALSGMGLVLDQARALFDEIHLGRKKAFGEGGKGYGDFFNFRWQAHKRLGTMQALNRLATARREAQKDEEVATYGGPLLNATQALTQAALWNRGR